MKIENLVMEVPLSLCIMMPRGLLAPLLCEFLSLFSLLILGFRMGSRAISDIIEYSK